MLDERGRLLRAALGFIGLRAVPEHPAFPALHQWLDSWRGIGQVAVGMHRQGWDLQLTEYGDGHWRAMFYVTGQGPLDRGLPAWEATPWRAVQRAARAALRQDRTGLEFLTYERCTHGPR